MAGPTALVTLTDVHAHLNIDLSESSHDYELQGFIDAAQPVIENIIGPVVQVTYTETYDGGLPYIELRHGPVLSVTSVIEYVANTGYTLAQAADPTQGTAYSFGVDTALGRISRRTSGGGIVAFAGGQDSVQVVYVVGRASVPANVRLATLELVRHWYQQTQQGGRPQFGGDAMDAYPISDGFGIPNRVKELLTPNRRAPSIA